MTEESINLVEELEEEDDLVIVQIFRFLLRIAVVIIFGIILGSIVYLGIPALYREFVEPVQTNTRQLEALKKELESTQDDIYDQANTVDEIYGLIEGSLAQQSETISELSAQSAGMDSRVTDLELKVEGVIGWERRLENIDETLGQLGSQVEGFGDKLEELDSPSDRLARQLQLIKAMELITRARYWFIQDNLGKAREDIEFAREVAQGVLNKEQESEVEILTAVVERLDQAIIALELTPVVAADDLEIVWQLLILATEP